MQKHDVLISFTDPEDKAAPKGANVYWAGKSQYPREGYTPPEKRLAYLLGSENQLKRPVIAPLTPVPAQEPKDKKQ